MTDLELFACDTDSFRPAHVLCAAARWGELDELYGESRHRLEALNRAREQGEEVADEALQARSEAFRRAHGLRTAQLTQVWMESRGVTVEAFTDFLERDAFAAQHPPGPAPSGRRHPARDGATLAMLWPDAVFTGRADAWRLRLAARAAASREVSERAGIPASLFDTGGGPDAGLLAWLEAFGLDVRWADRLRCIDSAYAHYSTELLTESRMESALAAHWEALVEIVLELGGFASEAAAREGVLCIEEDGESLESICAAAGATFLRGQVPLIELPTSIRAQALSSSSGALLPVFQWDERFMVGRVLDKVEPRTDMPRVRTWLTHRVLEEALRPLIVRHIRWPEGLAE